MFVQLVDLSGGATASKSGYRDFRVAVECFSPFGLGHVKPHEDAGRNRESAVNESGPKIQSQEHGRGRIAEDLPYVKT